jgi:hypothetical protein
VTLTKLFSRPSFFLGIGVTRISNRLEDFLILKIELHNEGWLGGLTHVADCCCVGEYDKTYWHQVDKHEYCDVVAEDVSAPAVPFNSACYTDAFICVA